MDILNLISSNNCLLISKEYIKKYGLKESVLLSALEYLESIEDKGVSGYFKACVEDLEELTTFNGYKQRKLIDKLNEHGKVTSILDGIPATRYIKINRIVER